MVTPVVQKILLLREKKPRKEERKRWGRVEGRGRKKKEK